ncbi:MAG: transposase [Verrucomicrobiota bacterium]
MAKRKRRTLTAQFKFQVALEALRELKSVAQIAAEHQVHPSQVTAWKKELKAGGGSLFERKNARNEEIEELEQRTEELERALGRTVVEKEFLVKKCKQLGIDP